MREEEKILKFWEENKIFEKSLEKKAPKGDFVFYDGPPFATGTPHYGHILAGIIKDAIPRYQTMKGRRAPRRWGWDCHGLPIENLIETELNLKSKKEIEKFGIEKFNKKAKESVLRYADEWKKIIPRIGRWVDMENDYRTMDAKYTESVWWVFKSLYDKGLIYEGYKSMHICPRCETTLSNFEVTQGYKEIKDIAVIVKFELEDEPNTFVLAWTTTSWTLPGNVALAINPGIKYTKILKDGENLILAKERLEIIKDDYGIVGEIKGKDLIGKKYKALFPYYGDTFKICGADFVSTDEGTGIVHIAPAFGEDDMELGRKCNLPFIQHVGMNGRFKLEIRDFAGLSVKPKEDPRATDIEIIKWLAQNNKLFSKESVVHSYPFCWRCDTPLLNYAASSWFVKVEDIKGKMIENNKKINWVPQHLRDGRFGKWLEGARDWAISRSRFWGAPLPVWKCEKCAEIKVLGSIKELGKTGVVDLHRPYIDEIEFDCGCGGKMRRIPEVFDCWFESGSMPYGQSHYPFEDREAFEKNFPAEFIAEGVDQTRGWFYTLLVLSTALFGKSAYKNVIANGIILAEDGQKMSKRLKNYPDPAEVMEKYGADALRYYLLSSPAVRAESLNFSEKGVDEVNRKVVSKIRNVLSFYKMYFGEIVSSRYVSSQNVLDKWIIVRLNELTAKTTEAMDGYELDRAVRPVGEFVDDLSNWYIRRSRDRFKSEDDDKENAIATTRYILLEFSKLIAPFMPFVAEKIYQEVRGERGSVHLEEWPEIEGLGAEDRRILDEMRKTREIVSIALEEREKAGIKIKQPLMVFETPIIVGKDFLTAAKIEINVKEIKTGQKENKLNTTITTELKQEGMARELTRAIQDLRKKTGLAPRQKIELIIGTSAEGEKLLNNFLEEIKKTTNTAVIEFSQATGGEEIKIEDLSFKIEIRK